MILLICAAMLEVGGDAFIYRGMRNGGIGLFIAGGTTLVLYGLTVNLPRWDFGRLMGVYIVLFFIVSQIISLLLYHEKPQSHILLGGAFIVCGGIIITFWQNR
jgi:small multidrug resistance family-3 protein